MSFRAWVFAVAFGLTFYAHESLSQEGVQSSEGASHATGAQQNEQARPSFVTAIEGIEAAIREAISQESEEARKAEAEQSAADLRAQKEMARWAADMAIAGIAGALFTFFGLVLIGFTLWETRKAAAYAGQMVKPAEESAKAAIDAANAAITSNSTMQRFGEIETRAYLSASKFIVKTNASETQLFIGFVLSNSGSSPAYNVSAYYVVFSGDNQAIGDQRVTPGQKVTPFPLAAVVAPNASARVWFCAHTHKTYNSDFEETPGEIPRQVEAVIPYQTEFDLARDTFSGELSIRIEITDEIRASMGTAISHKPGTAFTAYRSAWMNSVVETLSASHSYRLFRHYVRPKGKNDD